ncbi:MAG: uroporphyrinogen-III synthase [Pseudomonadota bacterium]
MSLGPILLTRPLADSKRLAALLEEDGIESLIWPLTRIEPVALSDPLPKGIDGLLITSGHGIRAFASLDARRDLPVFCVGQRTAEIARSLGFAMVLNAEGDGAALARFAAGAPCRHFFYPRGREVSHDLARLLAPGGKRVTDRVVYEALATGAPAAPVEAAFATGAFSAVTLWSARNAEIFSDWITANAVSLRKTALIAISQQVANAADDLDFKKTVIAARPNAPSMIDAIENVRLGEG